MFKSVNNKHFFMKTAILSLSALCGIAFGGNELNIPTQGNFFAGDYSFQFCISKEKLNKKNNSDLLAIYYGTYSTSSFHANGYILNFNPATNNITLTVGRGSMDNMGSAETPRISEKSVFTPQNGHNNSVTFAAKLKEGVTYTIRNVGRDGKQSVTLSGPDLPPQTLSYNGNMNGGNAATTMSSLFNKQYKSNEILVLTGKKFERKDIGNYRGFAFHLKNSLAQQRTRTMSAKEQIKGKLLLTELAIRMGNNGAGRNGMAALLVNKSNGKIVDVSNRVTTANGQLVRLNFSGSTPIQANAPYMIYFTEMLTDELKRLPGTPMQSKYIGTFRFTTRQACEPSQAGADNAITWGWIDDNGKPFHNGIWAPIAALKFLPYHEPPKAAVPAAEKAAPKSGDSLTDHSLIWGISAGLVFLLGLAAQAIGGKRLIDLQQQQREQGKPVTGHKQLLYKTAACSGGLMLAALALYMCYNYSPTVQLKKAGYTDEYAQVGLFHAVKEGDTKLLSNLIEAGTRTHIRDIKGLTALHHAALNNDKEAVRLLLNAADLDKAEWNELMLAVIRDDVAALKHLLSNGANANEQDNKGYSPLHIAAALNHKNSMDVLLSNPQLNTNCTNYQGDTPLHIAIRNKNFDCVGMLLRRADTDVNKRNAMGYTPIHEAADHGCPECVRLLIACGRCNLNVTTADNGTLLHLAVEKAHPATLNELIKSGKINVNHLNSHGLGALHLAARDGRTKCLQVLLAAPGIDVNCHRNNNPTALHLACTNGINDCAELLINAPGIDINCNTIGWTKNTPLHYAAEGASPEIVKLLLNKNPGAVNNINNDRLKETPLHKAAEANRADNIEVLLATKGITINPEDDEQNTPLQRALHSGALEAAEVLIKKGAFIKAKKDFPLIEIIDRRNTKRLAKVISLGKLDLAAPIPVYYWSDECTPPLIYAIEKGYIEVVEYAIDNQKEALLQARDNDGNNCLIAAARHGKTDIVKLLLDEELFDINATNNVGATALRCAVTKNAPKVVELLLDESDIDVNKGNNDGNTPLHKAAARGYTKCLELLLNHGDIDINKANKLGETPLYWSLRETLLAEAASLIKAGALPPSNQLTCSAAVAAGELDKLRNLLPGMTGAEAGTEINKLLTYAAQTGNTELLKLLLSTEAADVNGNPSLLCIAARAGQVESLKLLLDTPGIEPNATEGTHWDRKNALIIAIQQGHRDCVAALLANDKVDINAKAGSNTSVFAAINKGDPEIFRMLLAREDLNVNDQAPIFQLLYKDRPDLLSLLISHPDIDMDCRTNYYNYSPVDVAIRRNQGKSLQVLLKDGRVEPSFTSPAFEALIRQDTDALTECVMEEGFDIHQRDKQHNASPLHLAVSLGLCDSMRTLLSMPGTNVNHAESWGKRTLLHQAIEKDEHEIVSLLLEHPLIDPAITDTWGETPLELLEKMNEKSDNVPEDIKKKRNLSLKLLKKAVDKH